MTFAWTPHRFSGGALALDVANSVILRFDSQRTADRLATSEQLAAFSVAASVLSADRRGMPALAAVNPHHTGSFLALRESIDAHFRHVVLQGTVDNLLLSDLLDRLAVVFSRHQEGPDPCPVDLATAQSALGLIATPAQQRMKICPNCGWLFLDRSKNRSRTWCDMTVCGNRSKARLHYRRKHKEISP